MSSKKVGIIGSGLVGKSWAMIFASVGHQVTLYDIDKAQVDKALANIKDQLLELEAEGQIRGKLSAAEQIALITGCTDLKEAVLGSFYIQECVPEDLELKRKVWGSIDGLVEDSEAVLATSTSCIVPSQISAHLKHREQFIVAHPVNPPYFVPMVELVPAPWTRDAIRTEARRVMKEIGQKPVSMSRELPGFVLNRLQYAVINETWNLVADGAVSAEDIDVVMKDGLGMRYAVCGTMEVIHLNADGIQDYFRKYGPTINAVSKTMKPSPRCFLMETQEDLDEVKRVHDEVAAMYPLDKLPDRRNRRDLGLQKAGHFEEN